jgi:hypothetical protein
MKITRWIISVVAFFIVVVGFATEIPKLDIVTVEGEKALVGFRSEKPVLFEFTLQNSGGEIIYYKKLESPMNEYKKIVDFSEMGNGTYTICLNYRNCSVNRELDVCKNSIKVGPLFQCFEPYFCLKNGILNVSFFNVAQKNVNLNIYQNGKYITGICLGKEMALQKRLDITNLEQGNYKLVLTDWFKDHPFVLQK